MRARALRALGRLEDAEAALRAAHDLAASSQLVSVTWRLQSELACHAGCAGARAEADAARAEALAIVEDIASRLTDEYPARAFWRRPTARSVSMRGPVKDSLADRVDSPRVSAKWPSSSPRGTPIARSPSGWC